MARPLIFSPRPRENLSDVRVHVRVTPEPGGAVRPEGNARSHVAATLWTAGHS